MAHTVGDGVKISGATTSGVTVERDGAKAWLILPAISYDDFDRSGNFAINKLNKLFWYARVAICVNSTFSDILTIARDFGLLRTFGKYDVTEKFYHVTRAQQVNLPLKLSLRLVALEEHTAWYVSEIAEVGTDDILATCLFDLDFMDRGKTEKKPIPAEFREKYQRHLDVTVLPVRYTVPALPDCVYSYTFEVLPSDTDANGQTRSSALTRYCMDCASRAIQEKALSHFQQDLCHYRVRTIRDCFITECLDRDRLVVYCWESKSEPCTMYFRVDNRGKPIYHSSVQFYQQNK